MLNGLGYNPDIVVLVIFSIIREGLAGPSEQHQLGMFMMYDPMRILFKTYTDVQIAIAASERVYSILDEEPEKMRDGKMNMAGFVWVAWT